METLQGLVVSGAFRLALCSAIFAALLPSAAWAAKVSCACPANQTNDFYANPTVDRSSCARDKTYAPTGVASPAICAYPTLTAALTAASVALVRDAPSARAIAAGGRPLAPAIFASESFPFAVPCGVALTTTDDPAVGGSGLNPGSYVIVFNSGTADHAITLRGPFSGFTVQNGGSSTGTALACDAEGAAAVDSVILDGANGASRLMTGLVVTGKCAGTFSNLEARSFSGPGVLVNSSSPDVSDFVQADLHDNQIGLQALAGEIAIRAGAQVGSE